MSIRTAIDELERQKEQIEKALSPLYDLLGETDHSAPARVQRTPVPMGAAGTRKRREWTAQEKEDRAQKMRDSWARRKQAGAQSALAQPATPVPQNYEAQLAAAASEEPAPIPVVHTEAPKPPPATRKRKPN